MYNTRPLQEELSVLPEEALTRDIVIPLLKEMGYQDVRYVHGMYEHGVDIICSEVTPLGTEFCGVQVKAVPITGAKTKKTGNVTEMINQAGSALRHAFLDERDNTEKRLDKYFIITSASISDVSASEIRDALRDFGRTIRFVDGQALANHVDKHLPAYVAGYLANKAFVVELAHVLRSPLQGIQGDLSWLASLLAKPTVNRRAVLLTCARAEVHAQEISRKIRSYVQAVAPPRALGRTFKAIDLSQLTRSVLGGFEAQAAERGIALKIESGDLPPLVTDPDAMELILANLIDNAVKYSSDNRDVNVRLRADREIIAIQVEDSGLAIPASEMPLIWKRFYRGAAAGSRGVVGTGLGLFVVKQLVEEFGGKVEVACRPVTGTPSPSEAMVTITVSLPADPPREAQ
jgi:signal transduction histidine kinase